MYLPFLEVVHNVCRLMQPLISFKKIQATRHPARLDMCPRGPLPSHSIMPHLAEDLNIPNSKSMGPKQLINHWDFRGVPLAQDLPFETKNRKFTISLTPHVHKMAVSNPVGCVCVCECVSACMCIQI